MMTQRVLDYYRQHIGKPCPGFMPMSIDLHSSAAAVERATRHLASRGAIEVETNGNTRRVCVDGQWTMWSKERPSVEIAIMAALRNAAAAGRSFHGAKSIARAAGVGPGNVLHAVKAGKILHVYRAGVRSYGFVSGGREVWLSGPDWFHDPESSIPQRDDSETEELIVAKRELQKRGYPVYSATVKGGRLGLYHVGADILDGAGVIDRYRERCL